MDLVIGGNVWTIISVYCPQSGKSIEEKEMFYDELQLHGENCIVIGDFNRHVWSSMDECEGLHGGFGWGERNGKGENLLEFADSCGMIVSNTYFQKDDEKLITYKSGGMQLC